jgi:alpha-L-arabinofuranosidase
MIVFGAGKDQYYWWNIGGWGNTRHAIEFMDGIEKKQHGSVKGSIESDRWYDLKVEIDGSHVKCYIDGNKIHDFEEKPKIPKIGVSVAKDKAAGELIIKIANPLEQALSTAVNLNGIAQLKEDTAKVITLSGAKGDMNDLKNPEKVRQVQSTMKVAPQFTCDMPAMSVKFIRIKVE